MLVIVEFYKTTEIYHVIHASEKAAGEAGLVCDGEAHPTSGVTYRGESSHSLDLTNILECAQESDYYVAQ